MPRAPSKQAKRARQGSSQHSENSSSPLPKPSQRERLLASMARVCEREGYAAASVAKVIAGAGVGRVTFYQEFVDKQECFLASYEHMAQRILRQMRAAAAQQESHSVPHTVLDSLLHTLEAEPEAGWGMLFEPIGGGPELRAQARRKLVTISGELDRFLLEAAPEGVRLDVPPAALIGGLRHVIARRLRRVEYDILPTLSDDLLAWVSSYALPASTSRAAFLDGASARSPSKARSSGKAARAKPSAVPAGASQAAAAQRLPRGRRKQRESFVNRQLRERILGATAEMSLRKGYAEMTVADIVACAGIGRDVFYIHFKDKQDAFLAAQQQNLQDHLNACASAFFAVASWPQRMYNALKTVMEIIAADPALAHLWLVESFAAGPSAIQHAEEMMVICTLYLQEGYHYRPQAAKLPRLSSEAIVGAVYETVYREIDSGRGARVGELLPRIAYIAIAPFTGAEQAAELIEQFSSAKAA